MKKIFAVILAVALFLSLSIFAFAGDVTVDTQEISFVVNEVYAQESVFEGDEYLCYCDWTVNIYVFCKENTVFPEGVGKADEKVLTEFIDDTLITEGLLLDVDFKVISSEKEKINGVTAHKAEIVYSYSIDGETEKYSALVYILATKENAYLIGFDTVEENFREQGEANNFMKTCGIYGTYIGDDKCTLARAEGEYPSFNDYLVKLQAEDYGDDLMGNTEEFFGPGAIAGVIGIVVIGFGMLVSIGLLIAVIVLAVNNSKKSKIIKEYEQRINFYQNKENSYNPYINPQFNNSTAVADVEDKKED